MGLSKNERNLTRYKMLRLRKARKKEALEVLRQKPPFLPSFFWNLIIKKIKK
jgi:hypothetical protein